ncbi:hypothetical protein LptCag_1224 [Leptospirillum ferriphilum]|uniref:Uncharacterized protein n=1 Tax=Leptospirillum ferriphilum TaxID=178606 RepID=A0A094YMJ8_9BACT|nr:hypothetical protein LptCag_1224 [Leptospirillum ferriphilum]
MRSTFCKFPISNVKFHSLCPSAFNEPYLSESVRRHLCRI